MKSDLRNMVTAEEAYFADSVKYTTSTSCVNPAPAGNAAWCATVGNGRGTITVGTGRVEGWSVRFRSINTAKSCAIYVGAVTPTAPATTADAEERRVGKECRCRGSGRNEKKSTSPPLFV